MQDAHDSALIAQMATLEARVPFLHFFDGFRTSHELNTLDLVGDADIRAMIDDDLVRAHRARGLSPENPFIRGTAQNPDTFFQAREAVNPYYDRVPGIVEGDDGGGSRAVTGRSLSSRSNTKAMRTPSACVVVMGSGAETVRARPQREPCAPAAKRSACVQIHLYRPFPISHVFWRHCRRRSESIAVLDRTKESRSRPGRTALFLDVVAASLAAAASARGERVRSMPLRSLAGGMGLSSKDFTPAMAKAAFDELSAASPRHGFTLGIDDDVSHTSLVVDPTDFSGRARQRHPRRVLRPGRGRNGRGQQEQRQDHRRGRRPLCPGLLRL